MKTLDWYPPSALMLQAYEQKFNDSSLVAAEDGFTKYLKNRKLTINNISSILTTLVNIEDISSLHNFAQLIETNVVVHKTNAKDIFQVKLSSVIQNAENVLTADIDEVVLELKDTLLKWPLPNLHQHEHEFATGIITEVKRTYVRFKCLPRDREFEKQRLHVIFRSPRIPFRLMYEALRMLKSNPELGSYLFPTAEQQQRNEKSVTAGPESLSLINTAIAENAEQLQAVQQIVSGPSSQAPYIVFGPPGTGKTTTIVEAILQLYLRGKRILVAAGSNSACNTIALQIFQHIENDSRFDDKRVIRLFSKIYIKKLIKKLHPLVLKYSNFKEVDKEVIYLKIKDMVNNNRLIVCTLCIAQILNQLLPSCDFSYIFIDESAASSEPETLLGIVGLKKIDGHVILSGDHKQLGPVIKCKRADSLGLGMSLMERLLRCKVYKVDASGKYDCTLQTRLRRNYRSHPEILGIFNKLYYDNEVIPLAPLQMVNQAENWSILPNTKFPILFQATFGSTSRECHSTSSFNSLEAHVVCWFVMNLREKGLGENKQVNLKDIGIITPYLAQCKLLKQKLSQLNCQEVDVGTVESFQGREKPIIIASIVSSFQSPGFAANPRRLNVLLSRAKSLLIIVGNPISLRLNADFQFIIDQCELHGNLISKKTDMKKKLINKEPDDKKTKSKVKNKKNKFRNKSKNVASADNKSCLNEMRNLTIS